LASRLLCADIGASADARGYLEITPSLRAISSIPGLLLAQAVRQNQASGAQFGQLVNVQEIFKGFYRQRQFYMFLTPLESKGKHPYEGMGENHA
jgi:hypothetical protein